MNTAANKVMNNEYLVWNIEDFANGTPRQIYTSNVVNKLNEIFNGYCSIKCRFNKYLLCKDGFPRPPMLMRMSLRTCIKCNFNNTSYSSQKYCYKCAPRNSSEYNQYHFACEGFNAEHIQEEDTYDDEFDFL